MAPPGTLPRRPFAPMCAVAPVNRRLPAMNELIAGESEAGWEYIAPHSTPRWASWANLTVMRCCCVIFERQSAQKMDADPRHQRRSGAKTRESGRRTPARIFLQTKNHRWRGRYWSFLISANAVQSAPIGLARDPFSAAAVLTGTAAHHFNCNC